MKRVNDILIALFLATILVGCGRIKGEDETDSTPQAVIELTPTPPAAEMVQMQRDVTILADGKLVAHNPAFPLAFDIGGKLVSVTVEVGDLIAAGSLLAELDSQELENRLAGANLSLELAQAAVARAEQENTDALYEAERALEKAQIRLEQANAQDVDTPIRIATVRLGQAERSLADAQEAYNIAWEPARDWELQITKRTGPPGFEGPSLKEKLEAERKSTNRALAAAQDNLAITQAEYSQAVAGKESHQFELRTLPHDVALAEYRVEQLERGIDPSLVLNVEQAQLEVENLQRQIGQAQLRSPRDGVAISVNAAAGTRVTAGTPIITLYDPGELEFHTTNLSERDLANVRLGSAVRVTLKAFPDDVLEGTISRITPQAEGTVGDAVAFPVIIELETHDLDLLEGMTGRAEIIAKAD